MHYLRIAWGSTIRALQGVTGDALRTPLPAPNPTPQVCARITCTLAGTGLTSNSKDSPIRSMTEVTAVNGSKEVFLRSMSPGSASECL